MLRLTKNKRGEAGHIEMIISAIIFIGLVTAIFIFTKPIREPKLSSNLIDIVENELVKSNQVVVTTLPFKVIFSGTQTQTLNCISIKTPIKKLGIEKREIILQVLKDNKFEPIRFYADPIIITSGGVSVEVYELFIEKTGTQFNDFFYIQIAKNEDFSQLQLQAKPNPCTPKTNDAHFSVPRVDELISVTKLLQHANKNYETRKAEWKIPQSSDFSITIKTQVPLDPANEEALKALEKQPPESIPVFSRVLRKEVLKKDGQVDRADITIKFWGE